MNSKNQQNRGRQGLLAGMILGLALVAPLAAQTRLYVQGPGDNFYPVLKVSNGRAGIMVEGKLVTTPGQRFALRKVDEYLPLFIAVRDLQTTSSGFQPVDAGVTGTNIFNNQFHIRAKFEADYPLKDVFLVLEVESPNLGNSIFLYEVGRLEPGNPRPFSVDLSLDRNLGPSQFKLHLFVGGAEVFQSEQPAAYREEMLDRMVAKRIASVQQANPSPFFGPPPAYPDELKKSGLKGTAMVTLRITTRGVVREPMVMSASDPAFGAEALAAVRQWRFLPAVEGGQAVETRVTIPFEFDPPAGDKG